MCLGVDRNGEALLSGLLHPWVLGQEKGNICERKYSVRIHLSAVPRPPLLPLSLKGDGKMSSPMASSVSPPMILKPTAAPSQHYWVHLPKDGTFTESSSSKRIIPGTCPLAGKHYLQNRTRHKSKKRGTFSTCHFVPFSKSPKQNAGGNQQTGRLV